MRRPGPPLAPFVDLLWVVSQESVGHERERLLPTGSMELVFNLAQDELRSWDEAGRLSVFDGAVAAGAYTRYAVIDTAEQIDVAGVHFRPGGAFAFLGVPAGELWNRDVSLSALWGRGAGVVRERLLEASGPEARLDVLEAALRERLRRRPRERHPAVAWALAEFDRAPGASSIADVTARLGLDRRRFLSRFRDEVGLSPKKYCRVRRFQETLDRVETGRRVDWAGVAASCGYFDQSHLVRDFRAFSGLTPTELLARRGEHRNHVPMSD